MDLPHPDRDQNSRDGVRPLCSRCANACWSEVDARLGYPETLDDALTQAGWLLALIPQDDGGAGPGLAEASVIMEEIKRRGGNSGACYGKMYNMGTLLWHGSQQQNRQHVLRIASSGATRVARGAMEPVK